MLGAEMKSGVQLEGTAVSGGDGILVAAASEKPNSRHCGFIDSFTSQ